jgi:hypothetical protein
MPGILSDAGRLYDKILLCHASRGYESDATKYTITRRQYEKWVRKIKIQVELVKCMRERKSEFKMNQLSDQEFSLIHMSE